MLQVVVLLSLLVWAAPGQGQTNRGYYRFPAIHGNTVVFTAEGDLWQIGVEGGLARRLTTHLGEETRAAFSPDGTTIAFSANYEGPTEVYTMPASGGLPTRRIFEGANAGVVGWTPDGASRYRCETDYAPAGRRSPLSRMGVHSPSPRRRVWRRPDRLSSSPRHGTERHESVGREFLSGLHDRQGLIIDVRHNNGGNIDSWLLGKLLRRASMYWQPRTGVPRSNMPFAFNGHLVVLCDERTASDI